MHDFKKFPELKNSQMTMYYFQSPHKQIVESFEAKVTKIVDGDTIRVKCNCRDFDFPIRLAHIAAAEMNETGGEESKKTLASMIKGEEISIIVDPRNRVGKWGRIIGEILHGGININEEMMRRNEATDFATRKMSSFPSFEMQMEEFRI